MRKTQPMIASDATAQRAPPFDPRVAVNPLVDTDEADRRGDLDLGGLLDYTKRIRLQPASFDQRAKCWSGETLSIRRVEEGERERTAGGRCAQLGRVSAPDARHSAERQRFDIGAQ